MKKFKVSIIDSYEDFIRTDNLWLTMNEIGCGMKACKKFNKSELLICLSFNGIHFGEKCTGNGELNILFDDLEKKKIQAFLLYINTKKKIIKMSSMPGLTLCIVRRKDKSVSIPGNSRTETAVNEDDLLILFKGEPENIRPEAVMNAVLKKKSISYPILKSLIALKSRGLRAEPVFIADFAQHQSYEFPIKSSLKTINLAISMIKNKAVQYNTKKIWQIETVLQEALVNAVTYGNGLDVAMPLCMNYEIGAKGLRVFIKDSGNGFDVCNMRVPVGREALEKISGRGIYIMKKFSDAIFYNRNGNEVVIFFSFA